MYSICIPSVNRFLFALFFLNYGLSGEAVNCQGDVDLEQLSLRLFWRPTFLLMAAPCLAKLAIEIESSNPSA